MPKPYTNDDIPTIREHDASLNLWWDNPEDPRIPGVRSQIIRHLRDRGFRVGLDPRIKKDYPSISKDHHLGRKGDLHIQVERGGRSIKIQFWQEVVTENPNGGRYDFSQRQKMPYQIGKRYELERNLLVRLLGFTFEPCRHSNPLRGLAFIKDKRTNPKETFFPCPLGEWNPEKERGNSKCADGSLLHDGAEVVFIADWGPGKWRNQHGIAYHNINNMWWVLLPSGDVRNLASFQIHHRVNLPALPGRHIPLSTSVSRLNAAKDCAVKAENYERAAVLRDALKRMEPVQASA